MWRYEIIRLLRQSYQSLTFNQQTSKQQWNSSLDTHYQKPWIVHFAPSCNNHRRNINYLGRYIKRPPLSQSRLKHYDGKTVAFDYLDHNTNTHKTAIYETQDFIHRFVQHIPDKHFRMINFYGFLANRVRSKLLPIVYQLLNQTVTSTRYVRWRTLQKRAFGTDPLLCILCGSLMRFIHFTIKQSARNLLQNHQNLALAKIIF
jgi:hypothetical protein